VEKLLKALLTAGGVEAPKSHDIRRLTQLAASFSPDLIRLVEMADVLTAQAVEIRYPGGWHVDEDTGLHEVLEAARSYRVHLVAVLADIQLPRD
jgi:HEPN domain-containing protein